MGASCGCGKGEPELHEEGPPPTQVVVPPAKPHRLKPALQVALDRYELADLHEPGSDYRQHSCTDSFCCLLFLGALLSMGLIAAYAHEKGNTKKLHHGVDYHGHICGVDERVADKPYLFWCAEADEELNVSAASVGKIPGTSADVEPVATGAGANADPSPASAGTNSSDAPAPQERDLLHDQEQAAQEAAARTAAIAQTTAAPEVDENAVLRAGTPPVAEPTPEVAATQQTRDLLLPQDANGAPTTATVDEETMVADGAGQDAEWASSPSPAVQRSGADAAPRAQVTSPAVSQAALDTGVAGTAGNAAWGVAPSAADDPYAAAGAAPQARDLLNPSSPAALAAPATAAADATAAAATGAGGDTAWQAATLAPTDPGKASPAAPEARDLLNPTDTAAYGGLDAAAYGGLLSTTAAAGASWDTAWGSSAGQSSAGQDLFLRPRGLREEQKEEGASEGAAEEAARHEDTTAAATSRAATTSTMATTQVTSTTTAPAAEATTSSSSAGSSTAAVNQSASDVHAWLRGARNRTGKIGEWLLAQNFKLNLEHPMCVKECPKSNTSFHRCFHRRSTAETPADATGSFTEETTYHFRIVEDYATMRVAHYCLPTDMSVRRSLGGSLDGSQEALMYHLSQVRHAWPAVMAAVVLAVVLGFLYLCLLGMCPGFLIFVTFILSVVLPLAAGGISLWGWYMEDQQDDFMQEHGELKALQLPATGDDTQDFLIGAGLVLLGLGVALSACCMMSSIKLAIGSVDAACECLLAVPSMLFEPFFSVVSQLALLWILAKGFLLLLSCGDVNIEHHINLTYMRGISRSFVYHDMEYLYLVLYVVIAAWMFEFSVAMEKFVIAYSTQLWYFADYRNGRKSMPSCALLRGFCVGATCHLGTLALGALCIPPFRIAHWVHARCCRSHREDDDEEDNNEVSECLVSCCTCCWACWEGFVKFMHSDTYIVVAIDSYPFFPASQKAHNVDLYQTYHLGDPNNFMFIFQLWGILVVGGLDLFFTWLVVTTFPEFTEEGMPHFVENPAPIAVIGGVIGLLIGGTFMKVLRNIADTIVFCYALEREWREDRSLPMRDNVPPALESYLKSAGIGSRMMHSPRSSRRSLMRND